MVRSQFPLSILSTKPTTRLADDAERRPPGALLERWDTPVTQKEPRSVLYSLSSDEGVSWSDPQPFPRDP